MALRLASTHSEIRPCACSRSSSTSSPRPGLSKVKTSDSKRPEQPAQPARHPRLQLAAVDRLAAQGSGHCTIGRDQGRIRSQAQPFEQRRRVGRAPARGDGQRNARLLRGPQRPRIPRADLAAQRWAAGFHPYRWPPGERVGAYLQCTGRLRCGQMPGTGCINCLLKGHGFKACPERSRRVPQKAHKTRGFSL